MKTEHLNPSRKASLVLAVLLQLAPLGKFIPSGPALASSPLAIVLKWAVGAAMTLGGYHAVSGASDPILITSSTNSVGTNGVAYAYTITQSSPIADRGHGFAASPLPPGLTVTTIDGPSELPAVGRITGIPTASGVWYVLLEAFFTNSPPSDIIYAVPTNMTLTIFGRPVITAPPVNQTNAVGGTANLYVTATGLPMPALRWRFNATNVLSGQTNSTLTLSNLTLAQAGNYSVLASNSLGSVTSAVATLTLKPATGPPNIITPPQTATVFAGGSTNFTIVASGALPLTFVWRKNSVPIPNGTNRTLNLGGITTNDTAGYSVIVSNSLNSVTSVVAALNVVGTPRLRITQSNPDTVLLDYDQFPWATYWLEYADVPGTTGWALWSNLPPVTSPTHQETSAPATNGSARFFRQRVTIP
ncbi:MAG TPA: immunoglobulin domain-containing protein [Verrucomicrobiae bacterium]